MAKQRKIKRYRNIYSKGQKTKRIITRVLVWIVAISVMFFIGWGIYKPVSEWLLNPERHSNSSDASDSSGVDTPSQSEQISSSSEEQPNSQQAIKGVYMPVSTMQSQDSIQSFLQQLQGSEINAVLLDLKDTDGNVTYQSNLEIVKSMNTQSQTAVNIAEVIQAIKDAGYTPIARIFAFKDPLAVQGMLDAAVMYGDTDYLWIDNSAELGGKAWLNPYAQKAVDYVDQIVEEAIAMGFENIIMDAVHFPTGYSLEMANYGSAATEMTREEALQNIVAQFQQTVQEKNARVWFYCTTTSIVQPNQYVYGSNPLSIYTDGLAVSVMPTQFYYGYVLGETVLQDPFSDIYTTVKSALTYITERTDADCIAFLQGYSTDSFSVDKEQLQKQIQAVNDSEIENYIIYAPSGVYPLQ